MVRRRKSNEINRNLPKVIDALRDITRCGIGIGCKNVAVYWTVTISNERD